MGKYRGKGRFLNPVSRFTIQHPCSGYWTSTMTNVRYMRLLCIASIIIFIVLCVLMARLQNQPIWSNFIFLNSETYDNRTSICPVKSLSELESVNTSQNKIPLIFHQVYIYQSEYVPRQYVPLLQGCRKMNNDLVYLFWTKKNSEDFIDKYYPQYKELFQSYSQNVMRSDFMRVLILYHFGGIYADMDMECKKPFSKHLDEFGAGAIIDQERNMQSRVFHHMKYCAMNSVMIARKKHPFFKYFLEKFPSQAKRDHVMWKTGPFFLTATYSEYVDQKRPATDEVHLASPSWFSPLIDTGGTTLYEQRCQGPYNKMDDNLRLGCMEWDRLGRKPERSEDLIKNSVLVHRFLHLAYPLETSLIKVRVDLCETVMNIYKPVI